MQMVLQHQKQRVLRNGTTIEIGEDALPYADENLLIVADGLGGRGGFPHTKIRSTILNRESFYDEVFAKVFPQHDDALKQFVETSFRELFALKDLYFSATTATKRTSGYFASRLVVAIVLYEFRHNPELDRLTLFDRVRAAGENRAKTIEEIGQKLAQIIREKLTRIASDIGLELESRTIGSYLLPTTLSIALINERAEDVEELLFWAGDSRAYLWDRQGLAQLTEDHEKDETMTNLITLTRPYTVEGRYLTVKKPCILFEASDGCYKCPVFASPFDLEYVFLQAIAQADDFEQVSKLLDEQFAQIGIHDDSNTMALQTYGYADFAALKADVKQRLDEIHNTIVARLPGILERDYTAELLEKDRQATESVYKVKDKVFALEAVQGYLREQIKQLPYGPYEKERSAMMRQSEEKSEAEKLQTDSLSDWIKRYWVRTPYLRKYSTARDGLFGWGSPYGNCCEQEEESARWRSAYQQHAEQSIQSLQQVTQSLSESADVFRMPQRLEDPKTTDALRGQEQKLKEVVGFLSESLSGKEKALSEYRKAEKELARISRKYTEKEQTEIAAFLQGLIQGSIRLQEIPMPESIREQAAQCLQKIADIAAERKQIVEQAETLSGKYVPMFWEERSRELIARIWQEHREWIPSEVLAMTGADFAAVQAERNELARCLALRQQIYEEYDRVYRRFWEESRV